MVNKPMKRSQLQTYQLNKSAMKGTEAFEPLDQHQTLRPFRNWDTVEKEKEMR